MSKISLQRFSEKDAAWKKKQELRVIFLEMLARRRQERVDQRKADLDYDEKKLQELDEINAAKDAVLDARAQAVGEMCKKQVG